MPPLFIGFVALYPFLEVRITGDKREHHLLDRPRNVPTRTGIGAAIITFYGVLWLNSGNDLIATHFHSSINAITWVCRVLIFARPGDRLLDHPADRDLAAARRPRAAAARPRVRRHHPDPGRRVLREAHPDLASTRPTPSHAPAAAPIEAGPDPTTTAYRHPTADATGCGPALAFLRGGGTNRKRLRKRFRTSRCCCGHLACSSLRGDAGNRCLPRESGQ